MVLKILGMVTQEVQHLFSNLTWVEFTFNKVRHDLNSKCGIGRLE